MSCDAIQEALARFHDVLETEDGCRVTTHCLYPSFDPVVVYVYVVGGAFRVHDGGGAERSSWMHGRDDQLISKMMNRYASRYCVSVQGGALVGDAMDSSWLPSAILSVANASAAVANAVVERSLAAAEDELAETIFGVLRRRYGQEHVHRKFKMTGQSGRTYDFDFGIPRPHRAPLLIDTVVPHHSSISHKYVAFADVGTDGDDMPERWAVFDKPLSHDDASLMRQVAALVPVTRLDDAMVRYGH